MFCSEDYRTGSISSGNTEVFRKEELETRVMEEKRGGKQKRRDRGFKAAKTHSKHHSKTSGGDVLAQIKAKENIVAPSNGAQRITISMENVPALFTQKVGIYNKGKSSMMVSRRRALHEIQPSQKIVQETKRDLKRVLGYSDKDEHSPHVVRKTSQMMTGAQSINEPKQSSSEMEMSPPATDQKTATTDEDDTVLAIARRISQGLHPHMVYSDSDYLNNTKSELRKLLKQGCCGHSSGVQCDMKTLVSSNDVDGSDILMSPGTTTTTTLFDTLFTVPSFYDDHQIEDDDVTTSEGDDFRLGMIGSAIFESTTALGAPPLSEDQQFNLTEVELTTSNFVPLPPTSVDGAVFQMEPPPPLSPLGDAPPDFLDLLDTMQQDNGMIGNCPDNLSRPPGSKWMPTPERPPMFPQKLY